MKLRYVAIAVVMVLGCRKEGMPGQGSGSAGRGSGTAAADAAAPAADAAPPAPDAAAVDATPPAPDAAPPDAAPDAGGIGASGSGSGSGSGALPGQAEPCAKGRCAAGLACIEYYGIAGPRGPKFTSCEIRCGGGGACPGGQRCVTVADGPGQVCRPSR